MRFPTFSADRFQPGGQCYGSCASTGHRGRCPRMASSRASPPLSSWPTAATFIPVMLMGGPRHRGDPCQHRGDQHQHQHQHHHTAGPQPSHQPPPFCLSDCLSQPVISDAVSLAQDLLGELLGQPGCPGTEQRGQTAGRQPSSQQSSPGSCCDRASSASRCTQSSDRAQKSCPETSKPSAQKPSHDEKRDDSTASPKATQQKREGQSAAGKAESSRPRDAVSGHSLWSHSLYFPRFSPTKVSAKVNNGKVHVHAVHERTRGPSACLSKLEATRIVALPENVDQNTLTCTMKLDGTLVLQARWKENTAVKAWENKAERMDVLEDESEKVCALGNTAGDVQDSGDKLEQVKTEADSGEPVEEKADDEEGRQADSESHDPMEKEAACCKDELEEDQSAEQQLCQCPGDEAEGTDCEELKNELLTLQADVEDDVNNPTTAEENPITFAIIQEPEDESPSSHEETPHIHTLTHQSSTEDFVVIDEGSIDTGNATSGEELASVDQAQTEEEAAGEEQTDGTPDDTDPTRPIKRSAGQETVQDSEQNSTAPGDQPGTFGDGRGTPATPPHHAAFRASLPLVGFSPENVQVNLEGRTLHIAATRRARVGEAPYTESVQRQLELPAHLDVLTVRCVYEQDHGCLIITADPQSQHRQVPVVVLQ